MNNLWHKKSSITIIKELNSSEYGLSVEEAKLRLQKFGQNKLPEEKLDSIFVIFLRQFQSPLIYILLIASVIVFCINEIIDGSIILGVLLFNAIIGTIQEGKAQNTLMTLKKFTETKATVLRNGKEFIISDTEVALGDILILREGEKIPADARVIVSNNLKVDEATLTGESNPVHKISEILTESLELNYKNMVFKATNIVAGNGKAIVIAVGQKTVIGGIATKIKGLNTEIPLKENIRHLSKLITGAVIFICTFLFFVGIMSGKSIMEMFIIVVSLSVSIIPEGLPIVVTLILAMGVWRMGKRNALIKKMQAVEALGQAQIIAVDKTGTITKNELVIRKVYVNGNMFNIDGDGYEPKGNIWLNDQIVDAINHKDILFAGKIAAYCANARIMYLEKNKRWQIAGDPTEAAMLVFAQKLGFHKTVLENKVPIIAEIPFDYKLKYHALIYRLDNKKILTVVGAPEIILGLSSKIWRDNKSFQFKKEEKKQLESIFTKMSENGLRVIAFAETLNTPDELKAEKINNLTFVGFYGIQDTLRVEAINAIQKAKNAGIRVIMITGDHKSTAIAIAKQAGIYCDGDTVLTGADINAMNKTELINKLSTTSVFARVNPDYKLIIIKAFQAKGEIIAMTGDGVNDAPSLIAADLGIAMGNIGTEVTKEASDIVLLDDNFESIISAIEEGRNIYKTIKRVILYLFSTSLGEALTIIGALFLGLPLPILASQIIWLNFVTDSFLDVSLAMEPKEQGLLSGNFEHPKKYLIDRLMVKRMILMVLPMTIGTLFLFKNYYEIDIDKARTLSLTILAAFQWFNVWNCRSENKSIFQLNLFSNKFLLSATIFVIILQLFAIYNPFMQKFLHTTSLNFSDWLTIIAIATSIVLVEEARKLYARHKIL